MKQINNDSTQSAYNKEVRQQYYKLLKQTTNLLATIEQHELRCTLQREDRSAIGFGSKVHELISPLLYLSLECNDAEQLTIHWGVDSMVGDDTYSHITSRFVRLLYKLTALENTSIDIESCINTDYIITACSELYEVIEEKMQHHRLVLIKHKPGITRRKQMQAVA